MSSHIPTFQGLGVQSSIARLLTIWCSTANPPSDQNRTHPTCHPPLPACPEVQALGAGQHQDVAALLVQHPPTPPPCPVVQPAPVPHAGRTSQRSRLWVQGSIGTLLTALRSTVAISPAVEEAMRMVPRSLFLPPGQAALAWQARPVLPSGHSLILGSPQAEALALQVGACFAHSLRLPSWPVCAAAQAVPGGGPATCCLGSLCCPAGTPSSWGPPRLRRPLCGWAAVLRSWPACAAVCVIGALAFPQLHQGNPVGMP